MRSITEGNKKVIITEGDQWTVSTYIVKNDIIRDLDFKKFDNNEDCSKYVCDFFSEK